MRALLRRWLFENSGVKLMALVLAVTLFILVRGEKDTERSVRVRVAYLMPSDRVLVTDVPDSIDVWVRGSWSRIRRVDPADVDPIVVDLTKVADGDVTFDERAIRLPAGLKVSSIKPSKITVQFEYQKRVPILPEIAGTVADGYVVQRILAEPPVVGVRGPKGFIDALVDIRTLPVSVAGKRGPFRQQVALAPLPKGTVVDLDGVDVEVQIDEEVAQKTLTGLSIQLLPPGGVRTPIPVSSFDLTPAQVDVVLRGGRNAMKQVEERKVSALVELHIEDLSPGATRVAPVIVRGTPQGVAIEVHPTEISLSMRAPGVKMDSKQP